MKRKPKAAQAPDEWAERAADELLQQSGADLRSPLDLVELARALLGQDCFRYLPYNSFAGGAALMRSDDKWFICIARSLWGARLNHAIGHELGHYYCFLSGLRVNRTDEEQIADRIAVALVRRTGQLARRRGPHARRDFDPCLDGGRP